MKKLIKQFNICNIYIALWVLYAFHWSNADFAIIENISNSILGINMIISIWYTGYALYHYKLPQVFKAINILIPIFCIYGLIYIIMGPDHFIFGQPVKRGTYLLSFLRSFLPIYAFYVFTIKGYLTEKILRFWSLIFLGAFTIIYFRTIELHMMLGGNEEFVNNTGYLFVVLIPCVYYFKRKSLFQFCFVGLCFAMSILALKRGAILTALCAVIIFLLWKIKSSKRLNKIYIFGLISIAIAVCANFISTQMTNNARLQERIEQTLDGNTSHRDKLAHDFINYFENKTTDFQYMLGSGADATLTISNNWAHNDWLEIMICQGIFGLVIYLFFWLSFLKQWRITTNDMAKQIIGSYLIIYLVRSIFSMTYSMILTIAAMGIGFALAYNQLHACKSNQTNI